MRISDWSSDVCSSDLSDLGVRLLSTDDPEEAAAIAEELNRLNEERRALETLVLEQAEAAAVRTGNASVAVVSGIGWHPGVIGIVAGRLKERLNKPAIVIGLDEAGVGKGSGRSISGVALRSEEHTSELQSLMRLSYAVFCLKNN